MKSDVVRTNFRPRARGLFAVPITALVIAGGLAAGSFDALAIAVVILLAAAFVITVGRIVPACNRRRLQRREQDPQCLLVAGGTRSNNRSGTFRVFDDRIEWGQPPRFSNDVDRGDPRPRLPEPYSTRGRDRREIRTARRQTHEGRRVRARQSGDCCPKRRWSEPRMNIAVKRVRFRLPAIVLVLAVPLIASAFLGDGMSGLSWFSLAVVVAAVLYVVMMALPRLRRHRLERNEVDPLTMRAPGSLRGAGAVLRISKNGLEWSQRRRRVTRSGRLSSPRSNSASTPCSATRS